MEAAAGAGNKEAASTGARNQEAVMASGGVETSISAAGRRTTKLVKVEQWVIDHLLEHPKAMDVDRFACPPGGTLFDALAEVLVDDPEVEEMRAQHAASMAFYRKMNDVNEDILAQYKQKGYAMVEVEVMDDGRERLLY